MLNHAVWKDRRRLARKFEAAKPFKHVVIDGFLKPEFCARLLAEFPPYDAARFLNAYGHPGKATREDVRAISPAYRELDALLRSRRFLAFMSELVGIPGLIYDADYVGGGTHENLHNMELDPHVDFNYRVNSSQHRRVNMLLYLNPEWRRSWGGVLELHADPRLPPEKNRIKTVLPLFNRCVVFNTHERSWHGVSRIDLPADKRGLSRKSFALYLYSKERPEAETAPRRSTSWVRRGRPARMKVGGVLTRADLTEFGRRLAMRDMECEERQGLPARGHKGGWIRRPLPARLKPGRVLTRADIDELDRHIAMREIELEKLKRYERIHAVATELLRSGR